jgi:nitroreductase / dihydropteridine reductase
VQHYDILVNVLTLMYRNTQHTTHMNNIIEALNWRYATKIFDPNKKISDADLQTILEAGNLAPTSYGLQPFRIINVIDPAVRAELRAVSYNQSQVTDASALLVLAVRTDIDAAYVDEYVSRIATIRSMPVEALTGYSDMMKGTVAGRTAEANKAWSAKQSYVALGTMVATAATLGVDSCPMEGFDAAGLDSVLGLADHNLASVAYLTLGYRSETDEFAGYKKVRLAMEDFVIEK